MPELVASLDQLVSSCGGVSVSDKMNFFCKEATRQIMTSQWKDMILCILYHIIKAYEAGYTFTMAMALDSLRSGDVIRIDSSSSL